MCRIRFTQSWLQVTRLAIAALLCPVTLMAIAAVSLSAGAQICSNASGGTSTLNSMASAIS